MKRALLILALLIGIGFSAVTMTTEEAWTLANQYVNTGETVDLKPIGLTYDGIKPYYVMELKGVMNVINVMLPINAETKKVEYGDSVKRVIETHYLANYFAPDDNAVRDSLESTLSFATSKADSYKKAISSLAIYEAQLPSNTTLENLQPLKESLDNAGTIAEDLIGQIQDAEAIVSSREWKTTDVARTLTSLNGVFSTQGDFFGAVDEMATTADALDVELASNGYLLTDYYNLVVGIQGVLGQLDYVPTAMKTTLSSNKDEVNSFFNGLGSISNEYLVKLRNRLDKYISQAEIGEIQTALTAYSANYTYINSKSGTIPPSYSDDISNLYDTISAAQNYFNQKNYSEAKADFEEIDDLIALLFSHIGDCPPECSGGMVANSQCECACPSGTTESNGQCVSSGFSLNLPLIGGLIVIIALLVVFKYKDRILPKGGGEVEEKSKDSWTNYKF